jgi:hypothetical protein
VRRRKGSIDETAQASIGEGRDDLVAECLHRCGLLLERPCAQHCAEDPRTPAHQGAQRKGYLGACSCADDDDAASCRERVEVAGQVRPSDELEDHVRSARGAHPLASVIGRDGLGSELRQVRARLHGAGARDHIRADEPADLNGGGADTPVRAVDEQYVPRPEPSLSDDRIVSGGKRFGNGCRLVVVEPARHGDDVPLVHRNTVSETAASDEAEGAVADLPAEDRLSARDDRAANLQPGYVFRSARRCGVAAGPLREVGGVDRRIRLRDDDFLASGLGVGPLFETQFLAVKDNRAHPSTVRETARIVHRIRIERAQASPPSLVGLDSRIIFRICSTSPPEFR